VETQNDASVLRAVYRLIVPRLLPVSSVQRLMKGNCLLLPAIDSALFFLVSLCARIVISISKQHFVRLVHESKTCSLILVRALTTYSVSFSLVKDNFGPCAALSRDAVPVDVTQKLLYKSN